MMKKITGFFVVLLLAGIVSCDKNNQFAEPAGGNLPTNYVKITATGITPSSLNLVLGSSITFVNETNVALSLLSYDSVTLVTGPIAPQSSYYFKKDTLGSFPFHGIERPEFNGIFVIR